MVYGPIAAFLVEMFPIRIRYTSMSLPYHIGNGIFGGLLPAVATYLVTSAKDAGIEVQLDKREQAAVEVGTVVLVGSTAYKEFGTIAEDQGVVPGAKVYFAKYSGKTVKIGEDKHLLLNDEDIVGVISDE